MKELTKTAAGTLLLVGIFTACSPLASSVSKHGGGSDADSNSQRSKTMPNAPDPTYTNTSAPAPSPSPSPSSQAQNNSLFSNAFISLSEETRSLDFADKAEIEMSFTGVDHEALTPEEFQAVKSRDAVEISKAFTHLTIEVAEADVDQSPDGLKFLIKKNSSGRFELSIDSHSAAEAVTWFKQKAQAIYLH